MAGKGSLYKRGDTWWMQYYIGGRRQRESAETTRKEQAEALLRERLTAEWEGRHFPGRRVAKHLTVGKLCEDWLLERGSKRSISHDRVRLAKAREHFGEHAQASSVTSEDISAWRAALAKEGYAVATVNRHLAAIRAAFNLAIDRGHLHRNPMRGVRLEAEHNERDRLCSPAEYKHLRREACGDLRAVIVLGYWLGMRLGEIAGLTWDRVDLKAGTIRLRASATKEADSKRLPIPTEALAELKRLPKSDSGPVFKHTVSTYSREFGELCIDLKIEGLRFHDLRHTAATRMHEAGLDLLTIQAFTGHKTLVMLKRYAKVTDAKLRESMDKIESHATRGRVASKR